MSKCTRGSQVRLNILTTNFVSAGAHCLSLRKVKDGGLALKVSLLHLLLKVVAVAISFLGHFLGKRT